MSNQTAFKVGDKVVRADTKQRSPLWGDFIKARGVRPYYTVSEVRGSWLQLEGWNDSTVMYPFSSYNFKLYSEAAISDSWDYAEADRLEQAARSAITAYNAYIEQKPEKLYIPMYLPD